MQALRVFYGGSFNPVHRAHVQMACEVVEQVQPQYFSFVPCRLWPNKNGKAIQDWQRVRMLELALDDLVNRHTVLLDQAKIGVDTSELELSQTSYTVNSMERFAQVFSGDHIAWMMGMDAWVSLTTWHRWQELTNYGSLLVVRRPDVENAIPDEQSDWAAAKITPVEQLSPGAIAFVETSQVPISSSLVRDSIAREEPVVNWLAPPVAQFIKDHNLYR